MTVDSDLDDDEGSLGDWMNRQGADNAQAAEQRQTNERAVIAVMLGRAEVRRAYWRRELADERFDEFKPEMRRRIAVETTLIEGLENGGSLFGLRRKYQQDAVHLRGEPPSESEQRLAELRGSLVECKRRQKSQLEQQRLTPRNNPSKRQNLDHALAEEGQCEADLRRQMREAEKA